MYEGVYTPQTRVVESSYSQQYPIVHIGDACDVSCTGEFLKFLAIMRKAKHGWLMVAGNDEGFLYGNTHPVEIHPIVTMDDWRKGCLNVSEPMTKASPKGRGPLLMTSGRPPESFSTSPRTPMLDNLW